MYQTIPLQPRLAQQATAAGVQTSAEKLKHIMVTEDMIVCRASPPSIKQQHNRHALFALHRGSISMFNIVLIAAFMMSCLFFLLRSRQGSDLLPPSTIDYTSVSHSIANKVQIDLTVTNTINKEDGSASIVYESVNDVQKEQDIIEVDGHTNHAHINPIVEKFSFRHGDHDASDVQREESPVQGNTVALTFQGDVDPAVHETMNATQSHGPSAQSGNHDGTDVQGEESPVQGNTVALTFQGDVDPAVHETMDATQSHGPSAQSALQCELWRGEWVPDDNPPLYTNDTCKYINPLRNCMQNGRPDRGYLHWRWKPLDCELPRFNASYFLEMLRGKTLAFIGDSIARDHGESLLCALTQVEDAQQHEWMLRWFFPSYNFTLSILWSPFLVQYSMDKDYLAMLHLDVPDREWTNQLQEYDIAIFSTGYWHFRKSLYYVNNTLLGGSLHEEVNATKIDLISEFQMTMETVMRHIATQYRGIAMIRTVSVDHFEHGQWDGGGKCNRTHPYARKDVTVPQKNAQMNKVQAEELEKAMTLVTRGFPKLLLLNVTDSAAMRPDGHPDVYRNQPDNSPNDCLHWCLPGPIDMWNQLVLHTLEPIYRGKFLTATL